MKQIIIPLPIKIDKEKIFQEIMFKLYKNNIKLALSQNIEEKVKEAIDAKILSFCESCVKICKKLKLM